MACRIVTLGEERVESQAWEDIYNQVESEQEADSIYDNMFTDSFMQWYGVNWTLVGEEPTIVTGAYQNLKGELRGFYETSESISSVNGNLLSEEVINNKKAYEVKSGVSELFDSNSELANEIYEALGVNKLITPNDRIVFGHPTIGKSFLKKQGEDKFISLDDDYATEINNKIKEIADKYNVTTYQVKDGGTQKWNNEYNQMMQEMFNVAKQRAISENKTLFTSNTNLLKNNAESFDKVINLTDKEFERRIQERGAKYDTQEWKSQINEAISKLPANKVINTDKYLSDLFITPQQKQQAQQLYSQYLDTIFPDSKVKEMDSSLYISVLNQLEQENKIEKDCSGGKLKAKDGLRTKFTKGSQWEIVKDLKGYPSHSQGGVDVKIGKNGFSFTRDNGVIEAKYGLVLPKIK
jgi:hypothetical protein